MHYQIIVITIYFYEPKDSLLGNITGDIESLREGVKKILKKVADMSVNGAGGGQPPVCN